MYPWTMRGKLLWLMEILLLSIKSKPSLAYSGEICGPTSFAEPTGTISFPNARGISENSTCYYRIDVGDNNFVSLRFQKFDVPTYMDFCNRAWLKIGCVSNEISGIVTRKSPNLCGEIKWSSTLRLYDCPVLSLELLYSRQDSLSSAFTLKYEITPLSVASNSSNTSEISDIIDCGQTFFTNRSGVIALPNRQNITRTTINCTYTISTGNPDALMSSLTLNVTFLDLLTLADELDGCTQDRLQIICTDVNERHLSSANCERFSSDLLANPKYYRCLKLEIILQSDTFDPSDTRQIAYDMILAAVTHEGREDEDYYDYDYNYDTSDHRPGRNSTCGDSVYTEQNGFVTSPHFPLVHPHGLNCTYRIMVGRKNILSLTFVTFDLEGDNSAGYCNYDWLTISCVLNGTSNVNYSALRKFCGQIKWSSELIYSNCSSVVLQFRSDYSVAKGGFKIQYSITKDSPKFQAIPCGRTELNESDGAITFPYDPNGYVTRINCVYTVYANASRTFALDMKALNWARLKQEIGNCVQFYCEGEKNLNFSSCQGLSGQMSQTLFFSKCQKLRLSIFSEYFDYSQEYRLPFKVISTDEFCGNTSFSKSNGTISLRNVPAPPNFEQNCTYSITGGINTTISISFVEPQIQYSYPHYQRCTNRVTLTCLQSTNFNPYSDKRLCTQMRWPSIIHFFNCSALMVAFEFGDIANAMKFKLNYTVSNTENRRTPEYLPELRCIFLSRAIALPFQSDISGSLISFNCSHSADVTAISKGLISVDFRQIATAFEYARDCSQDNVTISCVSDKATANINSTKKLTFCSGEMPTTLTVYSFSNCSQIKFTLRSRAYYPIQSRSLTYRINSDECGNTSFVSSSGNITSPRFPLFYPSALSCIYNIEAGDRKAITLRSLTFQLQGRSSERSEITAQSSGVDYKFGDDHNYALRTYDSCHSDWLIFRCVSNGSLKTPDSSIGFLNRMFCGSKTFETTIYGCQTLRLELTTSSEVRHTTASGFNIHYDIKNIEDSAASCSGDSYFNDSSGTIVSPGYLQFYPNGLNCNYIIAAGRSRSVMLKFLNISLQHGTHRYVGGRTYDACDRDWIQIRCSSRQTGEVDQLENRKFCGYQQPFTVLMDGCSYVNVTFISDSTISSQGFKFQYTVFPAGEECGKKDFSDATGVITSPAFPSPYPHRANCTYSIEVGSNNSLSIQFLIFDVGLNGQHYYHSRNLCTLDWVKISCVSRESRGPLVANQYLETRLCGYKTPFNTTLYKCNRYALEFVSAGSYSKRGFQIQYTISTMDEKCGNKLFSNKTGVIASPGFPRSNAHQLDCVYYIEVGANKTLSLQFLTFNIGTLFPHQLCINDWVKILCLSRDSDESVSTAESFNRELCGSKLPFNLTLTGCSQVAVKLSVSRGIRPGAGFNARYLIYDRSFCGYPSTTFTDTKGVIVSPDLAMEHKPTNISCTYFISAQQKSAISLSITAIHKQECNSNWLSIRCLKNDEVLDSSLKLCEKRISVQDVVFPSCSSIQIKYRSTIYDTHFFILYTIKEIGTNESSLTTTLPSVTTDLCPNECPKHSNGTSPNTKRPEEKIDQTTTSTEQTVFTNTTNGAMASLRSGARTSFVGSKSFGVLIACLVLLLLVVASVVAVVVWLRRRSGKRNEDETMLINEDGGHENFTSHGNPVFSPFSPDEEHQSGANCYVHLTSMASSNLS